MSTDFTTMIPCSAVDEKKLKELVEQLSKVTGDPIYVRKQFVLSAAKTETAIMLDSLRDAIRKERKDGKHHALAAVKAAKLGRPRKDTPAGKPGKVGGASWENEKAGTIMSTRAIHEALAAGDGRIAKGDTFVNAKGERAVILPNEAGDLQLIKEPKP